jgi:hypothetical protein
MGNVWTPLDDARDLLQRSQQLGVCGFDFQHIY